MVPNGLVPSLLVFGCLPSFPVPSNSNLRQQDRFVALKLGASEMETIVSENRIKTALRSKLPPSTHYLIKPGDQVRVYREKPWDGPYKVTKVAHKIISVTDGTKVKQFNISSVLPITPDTNDNDLNQDITTITKLKVASNIADPEPKYLTEVVLKSYLRYTSTPAKDAINAEVQGLLQRNSFAFVKQDKLPQDANILGGRFILAIKQPGTQNERYKERFVVQGHRDREKDLIVHTSRTVRHRNIRLMACIASMFPKHKIWLQDVTQEYIQGHDVQRNIYVKPAKRIWSTRKYATQTIKPIIRSARIRRLMV